MDSSLIEDMNEMGEIMKQQIIEEQKIHPDNFINIDQTLKNNSNQNFPLALLAKNLESNGVTTAIQKQSRNKDLTKTCLQLMTNGLVNKQKCKVKFDYGNKKNDEILNDENEKEKFISEWKNKIAQKLNISPDLIIITNLRKGSIEADIFLKKLQKTRIIIERHLKNQSQNKKHKNINNFKRNNIESRHVRFSRKPVSKQLRKTRTERRKSIQRSNRVDRPRIICK